ncbi:hypothetical protein JMG10_26990 [Nostoc ellipsosporum NOK]|nr:hypothetical protein [Nostoc ellipsosporum NOK]
MKQRLGKYLKAFAVIVSLMAAANAFDYFFGMPGQLGKVEGDIERLDSTKVIPVKARQAWYYKTELILKDGGKDLWIIEGRGDKRMNLEGGDHVVIYTKHWYQWFYGFFKKGTVFLIKKDGAVVYDNLIEWKNSAFAFMVGLGICSIVLWLAYFDLIKNKSITNWVQQKKQR